VASNVGGQASFIVTLQVQGRYTFILTWKEAIPARTTLVGAKGKARTKACLFRYLYTISSTDAIEMKLYMWIELKWIKSHAQDP